MIKSRELLLFITITGILTGCDIDGFPNDIEGCEGAFPVLVNPVPDTTIAMTEETMVIDLAGDEDSVFRRESGDLLDFDIRYAGGSFDVQFKNNDSSNGAILTLDLEQTGEFLVVIEAFTECVDLGGAKKDELMFFPQVKAQISLDQTMNQENQRYLDQDHVSISAILTLNGFTSQDNSNGYSLETVINKIYFSNNMG